DGVMATLGHAHRGGQPHVSHADDAYPQCPRHAHSPSSSEAASSTRATVINIRPRSARCACGSPRLPAHSAVCLPPWGGPQALGGVGPNSTTEDVPVAVAMCPTPVS